MSTLPYAYKNCSLDFQTDYRYAHVKFPGDDIIALQTYSFKLCMIGNRTASINHIQLIGKLITRETSQQYDSIDPHDTTLLSTLDTFNGNQSTNQNAIKINAELTKIVDWLTVNKLSLNIKKKKNDDCLQ